MSIYWNREYLRVIRKLTNATVQFVEINVPTMCVASEGLMNVNNISTCRNNID